MMAMAALVMDTHLGESSRPPPPPSPRAPAERNRTLHAPASRRAATLCTSRVPFCGCGALGQLHATHAHPHAHTHTRPPDSRLNSRLQPTRQNNPQEFSEFVASEPWAKRQWLKLLFRVRQAVNRPWFGNIMLLAIVANTIVLAMEFDGMSAAYAQALVRCARARPAGRGLGCFEALQG